MDPKRRVPPPGRGQADRAGRRAAGRGADGRAEPRSDRRAAPSRGRLAGRRAGCCSLAACSSGPDKPKPTPLEPITRADRRRARSGRQRIGERRLPARRWPSTAASFTVAGSDGTVAALARRHRPRALARQRRRPHRRRRRQRRPLRRRGDARQRTGRARRRQAALAQAARHARSCTAPLVAGERVFVLGVDRRVQRLRRLDGRKLWTLQRPGEPLTLAQARRAGRLQGHAAGRAGPAPGRPRPAARHRCAGRCRWPRRAAPTRSSAWSTWSAPARASATRSARAPSSPPSAASTPSAARCCGRKPVGGTEGVGRRRAAACSAPTRSDRITAWRTRHGEVAWTHRAAAATAA